MYISAACWGRGAPVLSHLTLHDELPQNKSRVFFFDEMDRGEAHQSGTYPSASKCPCFDAFVVSSTVPWSLAVRYRICNAYDEHCTVLLLYGRSTVPYCTVRICTMLVSMNLMEYQGVSWFTGVNHTKVQSEKANLPRISSDYQNPRRPDQISLVPYEYILLPISCSPA